MLIKGWHDMTPDYVNDNFFFGFRRFFFIFRSVHPAI